MPKKIDRDESYVYGYMDGAKAIAKLVLDEEIVRLDRKNILKHYWNVMKQMHDEED